MSKKKIKASGCIILSEDTNRILLQLRSPNNRNKNYWGFWGGRSEDDESPIQTVMRELEEELGFLPTFTKIYPLHKMVSNDGLFEYMTYLGTVPSEFIPKLNSESDGYAWVDINRYPIPLHPGVKIVLHNPQIISKILTIVKQIKNVND